MKRRYYLDTELFPKKVEGGAQVPYLYSETFCQLMNKIARTGTRGEDARGVY